MIQEEEEENIMKTQKSQNKEDHYASTDSSAHGVIETDIFPKCGVIKDDTLSKLQMKSGRKKKKSLCID